MAQIETWFHNDLKNMPKVEDVTGVLFTEDNGGNRIGVVVTDDGVPVSLIGNVKGYVILNNQTTQEINGSLSDINRASISLPSEVYAVPGPFTLFIKLDDTTIGACSGYIRKYLTEEKIQG